MRSTFLSIILLVLLPFSLAAGVRSFRVEMPERAVQGETVEVRYVMDVTGGWGFLGYVKPVDGVRILGLDHTEKRVSGSVLRVTVVYRLMSVVAGPVEFPSVEVITNSKSILYKGGALVFEPHPDYGNEWLEARDFLQRQGVDCKELEWCYSLGGTHAFYDVPGNSFAWVGASGVVAYGIDATMWDGKAKSVFIDRLFGAYEAAEYAAVPEGTVEPLLGDIAYGQDGIYCEGFPTARYKGRDSVCVAGCGAVTLAQILRFYGPSVRPSGKGEVTVYGESPKSVEMHDLDWDNLKVNELMYLAAASVQTRLSPDNSASKAFWFRRALVDNWGFSPVCRHRHGLPNQEVVNLICADLDAGRPAILSADGHSFICDGYKDGFLHFNFGWKGHCNGWYRLPDGMPIEEFLTDIVPMLPEEDFPLEVELKKPGTLASAIPEDDFLKVTRLKVSGKIRNEDIALLRRMATEGMLMELDLSEARILKDGSTRAHHYAEMDAVGMTFSSRLQHPLFGAIPGTDEEWTIKADMSDYRWHEMVSRGLTKGTDFSLVRDEKGIRIRYFAQTDIIGTSMFADCGNLRILRLPASVKGIKDGAFLNCICLEKLFIPEGLTDISSQALVGTPSLMEVVRGR